MTILLQPLALINHNAGNALKTSPYGIEVMDTKQ